MQAVTMISVFAYFREVLKKALTLLSTRTAKKVSRQNDAIERVMLSIVALSQVARGHAQV